MRIFPIYIFICKDACIYIIHRFHERALTINLGFES